jgi:hypothetical protein
MMFVMYFPASFFEQQFLRTPLQLTNVERSKGGLANTTWREILKEAQNYEKQAIIDILAELDEACKDVI